ncbi:amino acid ABC transporter permease [Beijerinckia indica]|uniref:Binding-protein-dependent transport systems inner membrane component n=1 Tax=Beijerinckia indica subsp. indica (strain ATCC 9039 / DSM 1715 / NCIMB 8712) TaxID=395963 RepID=B2IBX5_BEII9|nr:ABC transporter permease subunit [Beijerinckia indica]ACB95233.1 binding-protein-dependent transport systems inner membrane component [Beijerinckia indica subsp. indica ATCC 9039]
MSLSDQSATDRATLLAVWRDPRKRGFIVQALFVLALCLVLVGMFTTLHANMVARGIPTDFSFWNQTAGFDINQTPIAYSPLSTYGRAFLVGLINTLIVASIGLVCTTIIGVIVGISRLSKNRLVSFLAATYVETLRNIPLLLQLLFWYNAILKPLPGPRQSLLFPFGTVLNNRGLFLPLPSLLPGAAWVGAALALGLAASFLVGRGTALKPGWPKTLLCLVLALGPAIIAAMLAPPLAFDRPILKGFNYTGGFRVLPELVALLLGLSLYTAAFIAEIIRAGIMAVPRGQSEAAEALGLPSGLTMRRIILPQALRVVIPPLTSQYLNLIKNSSLAVFIGYPDLVQVFAGTVLNQTGAAVQIIFITMAVYLAVSLVTSFAMNLINRRMALVER